MTRRIPHREEAIHGPETTAAYEENHERHSEFQFQRLLSDFRAREMSGDVLEIGAGTGVLAALVAEDNPRVRITAVDLSPDMLRIAEKTVRERGLQDRIRCVAGNVADKDFLEGLGRYDAVYSAFSLHHWTFPETAIKNLWEVVKQDGLLYLYDLKRVFWLYALPVRNGFLESVRAAYRPREIGAMLENLGITPYSIRTRFPFFMVSVTATKGGGL